MTSLPSTLCVKRRKKLQGIRTGKTFEPERGRVPNTQTRFQTPMFSTSLVASGWSLMTISGGEKGNAMALRPHCYGPPRQPHFFFCLIGEPMSEPT
jgi:hypothetical protein